MSRLSGRDPLSIAPGGIGTGAAQVFDFQPFDPTEKIADAAIANAQRKQKAQAKAQEEYQNKINLFRKELDGWQDRDGEVLNKLTEDIINEGARIAAKGIDPTTLPDYRKQMEKALLLGKKSKQDKEFYDNAFKVAMEKSKSPIYSQEDIDFDLTNLETFAKSGLGREQFQIPLKAKEERIDWFKELEEFASKTKQDLFVEEIGDETISEKFTPQQRIESRFETFKKTPQYKAAIKAGETDDSLKKFIAQSLPYEYRKQLDEEKGGIDIDFGNGTIVSGGIKAIYAPDAYKTLKTVSPKVAVNMLAPAENVIMQEDGAIIFNPKPKKTGEAQEIPFQLVAMKNSDPIKFRANALFKAPNGKFVMVGEEEVIIPQVTQSGTTQYTKTVQPLRITVSEQNKEEFENRYLGGMPMEEAFENFKSQRKATQPTPQSTTTKPATTTNKFDKYKRN